MKINRKVPYIIFLTGASGAGKTTLLESFSSEIQDASIACLHFDSIGVPSEEEMVKNFGSPSEWQEAMTYLWVEKLISEFQNKKVVIIEGQVNLAFIVSAFEKINFSQYKIVLVHCDALIRHQRLHQDRNQPELINETMDTWSNFLKKQAIDMNAPILDATSMNKNEILAWFKEFLLSQIYKTD